MTTGHITQVGWSGIFKGAEAAKCMSSRRLPIKHHLSTYKLNCYVLYVGEGAVVNIMNSSIFACTTPETWQRHTLTVIYVIILYLPSSSYRIVKKASKQVSHECCLEDI